MKYIFKFTFLRKGKYREEVAPNLCGNRSWKVIQDLGVVRERNSSYINFHLSSFSLDHMLNIYFIYIYIYVCIYRDIFTFTFLFEPSCIYIHLKSSIFLHTYSQTLLLFSSISHSLFFLLLSSLLLFWEIRLNYSHNLLVRHHQDSQQNKK